MRYSIRNLIGKAHAHVPTGLSKAIKFILILIPRITGYYFLPVWFYSIRESEGGELFSFVHIGWDEKLRYYWLNRFFGDCKIIPQISLIAISRIPGFLRKNKQTIDFAIIESKEKASTDKYPNSFLLPRWMEMELDIESSLKKSRIKDIKRNIKKYSLDYEIRNGIEAFDLFYNRMYRPYILKRHQKSAQLVDYRKYSEKFFKSEAELFFLKRENVPLAAAYVELKEGLYRLSLIGVKDETDGIFKMGVIDALYYFFMGHYYEKGIDKLLIGLSMAVVFDGVTEFKKHLGARPFLKDLKDRRKYYFVPVNTRPITAGILKSNPLFHISGVSLNIAVFVDGEDYQTKDEFLKFFNRVKTPNVEKTIIFYFENPGKIIEWINEEAIPGIEFINFGRDRINS